MRNDRFEALDKTADILLDGLLRLQQIDKECEDMSSDFRNRIFNEDCMTGLDHIPDNSVDLVVMDPPYQMHVGGSGCFKTRKHFGQIRELSNGISDELLEKIVSKLKAVNLYVWCNKDQIRQYLNFFAKMGGGEYHYGPVDMA